MKSLIRAVAVAALIALPVASFAQTAPQNAAGSTATAQQRVDAKSAGGYGGVADTTSQSGSAFDHPQYDVGLKSIYVGH